MRAVAVLKWSSGGLLLIGGGIWLWFFWPMLWPIPQGQEGPFFSPKPAVSFAPPYGIEGVLMQPHSDPLEKLRERLRREAVEARKLGPWSVMQKEVLAVSGDPHDFHSLMPYLWPTRWIPGGKPWTPRDGKVNPEARSRKYDRTGFLEMTNTVEKLCWAYAWNRDEADAQRAALLLRTWFLDPASRMNPHFQYDQAVPGLCSGYTLGVIRGVELLRLLDASCFLEGNEAWTNADQIALRNWFGAYFRWVWEGAFGSVERARSNNHGTWYDAHVAALAFYVDRPEIAQKILSEVRERRWEGHIKANGDQPEESRRTKSGAYAIFNLKGLCHLALLGERMGASWWKESNHEGGNLIQAWRWIAARVPTESLTEAQREDFISLGVLLAMKSSDPGFRKEVEPWVKPESYAYGAWIEYFK